VQENKMLEMFDTSPLTGRFWLVFGLICSSFAFDFFDFYIVGFLVSVIGPAWHLTYLESSIMLMTAGVGAILGALIFGTVADILGRKPVVLLSMAICAVASCGIAISPEGNWIVFAILRFFVGLGIGGVAGVQVVMGVEMTPTRYRAVMGGMPIICPSLGTLLASFSAAHLISIIGWRGLALMGAAPGVVALLMYFLVPESMRWLLTKGKVKEAREGVATMLNIPVDQVPLDSSYTPPASARSSLREVYVQPTRFWVTVFTWVGFSTANYGVYLWGPTIVSMLLKIDTAHAASYFVYVAATGIIGRVAFCVLPIWMNRRWAGAIAGTGVVVTLAAAAIYGQAEIWGLPAFIVLLAIGAMFYDGGFCVLSPYTAEVFPVRLSARGIGVAQAANGIGKIAGPMCLAFIAGANNLVAPKATVDAIFPAFMFLAGCGLLAALSFAFLAPNAPEKSLPLDDEEQVMAKPQVAKLA
jgi:MFS transporter, putative metabolite:H+ symporter